MSIRFGGHLVTVCGWAFFGACLIWPALALLGATLAAAQSPSSIAGQWNAPRQLVLLGKSLWPALVAGVGANLLAIPIAFGLATRGGPLCRPLSLSMLAACLLTPPMVYTFAWERLAPPWIPATLRCILVWVLWSWPIPAALLSAGWARSGRSAYESALLSTTPWTAFRKVGLPSLRPHLWCGTFAVSVLCFNDYGVPHACGLLVYPTELLGLAQEANRTSAVAIASIPSVLTTAIGLAIVTWQWKRCSTWGGSAVDGRCTEDSWGHDAIPLALLFAVSWVMPIGVLVARLGSLAAMEEAMRTYGRDWIVSLATAGAASLAVVVLGLGVTVGVRGRWPAMAVSLMFGAVPGALIGEALVAGYNLGPLAWIYDHWPVVAIGYTCRFAWIGVLAGWLVVGRPEPEVIEAAWLDGADRASIFWHIYVRGHWPTLVCAAFVVAALSLADVATSSLVRVPGFNPIAHVLMEKFHRFEYGMLVALSLWLVAATVPAVLAMAAATAWQRSRSISPAR